MRVDLYLILWQVRQKTMLLLTLFHKLRPLSGLWGGLKMRLEVLTPGPPQGLALIHLADRQMLLMVILTLRVDHNNRVMRVTQDLYPPPHFLGLMSYLAPIMTTMIAEDETDPSDYMLQYVAEKTALCSKVDDVGILVNNVDINDVCPKVVTMFAT